MSLSSLQRDIEQKSARLAVIGLGYVGLPVACEFARAGLDVVGVDLISERVEKINHSVCPIEGYEPGLADVLYEAISSGRLRATTSYQDLKDRDVILIAVETPVDRDHRPRYIALRAALESLGLVLKREALVIIESTIAPGTMRTLVRPTLEKSSRKIVNNGFYLGNCPERVMPGRLLQNLRQVSRVAGGWTPETASAMVSLYRHIVHAELDPTDCLTAELVKTAENAYRDVQIAFANEVALLCESLGGDVWKVRELVNKSPGRQMHLPGAGVGGHCIPKDPWLLIANAPGNFQPRLIPAARAINDGMPLHIAELTIEALEQAGISIENASVAVLGYAYLENSDDTRNSPSAVLVDRLQALGMNVRIHDPYVTEYQGPLDRVIESADAVIVMVAHDEYRNIDIGALKSLMAAPVLIDGRKVFDKEDVISKGFIYRGVGQAGK